MSQMLAILGLAVSSNIDTLGVGLAYGTKRFRLPFSSNLVCATVPCVGTFLMMVLGTTVRRLISDRLGSLAGAAVIMAAGVVISARYLRGLRKPARRLQKPVRQRVHDSSLLPRLLSSLKELGRILEDPLRVDFDYSGSIEISEALLLSLALTLNNLSCGLAAGLMGLNVPLMIGSCFVISLVFFLFGIRIGLHVFARWFGAKGELVAGIMLILLGLYELLT